MVRLVITFILILLNISAYSQQSLDAIVIDIQSKQSIPYASIHIVNQQRGTYTDNRGHFYLDNLSINDSVEVSFIGYHTLRLDPILHFNSDTLYLEPKIEQLQEATVFGDSEVLYEILSKGRKTATQNVEKAKTYFSLETFANDKKVEWLECYYNGRFKGYDVENLELKNGRIALDGFENRFFVSTETSKALNKYSSFKNNPYFPDSPLRHRRRSMQKHYSLHLISKYLGANNENVFVIDFNPKKDPQFSFSGTVWIDSTTSNILKISYKTTDASTYPFDPLWDKDSLVKVDLQISKTYQPINGKMYVKSIDFYYDLYYQDRYGKRYNTSTKAILYAYNYDDVFTKPKFNFEEMVHGDYIRINASPYNSFFWENINEFVSPKKRNQNELFVKRRKAFKGESLFQSHAFIKKGFIKNNYTPWSRNRIEFANAEGDSLIRFPGYGKTPSERYKLSVQLYMDVNMIGDSIHILTRTIFDPFKSFYLFKKSNKGMAFINMYFDIMEIERRKFEKEIRNSSLTVNQINKAYEKKLMSMNKLGETFLKEVARGENLKAMQEWNIYILEYLNINNMELFGLESPNEIESSLDYSFPAE